MGKYTCEICKLTYKNLFSVVSHDYAGKKVVACLACVGAVKAEVLEYSVGVMRLAKSLEVLKLDAFEASSILAFIYCLPKEQTLEDIVRAREKIYSL